MVGAYRDTEAAAGTALATAVADLAQGGLAAQHALGPLAPADATHLLAALCADVDTGAVWTERQEWVLRRAGGVPFVLVRFAQALREDAADAGHAGAQADDAGGVPPVPWDVAQGVRQRVAALPELAQEVLAITAVLGREAPQQLLPAVADASEEALVGALEAACRARLLEETEAGYRFAHDVLAEVVEAELSGGRRRLLHRRVAEALEQHPGERPVEALAYHFGRAEEGERALPYLEAAGDRARERHAYDAAEGYYRATVAGLDERRRQREAAAVREKLGRTLRAAGRHEAALGALEAAAGAHEAAGDVEGQARSVAEIGRVYYVLERPAEGIRRLQPLAAALEGREASTGLAALVVVLASLGVRIGSGSPDAEKIPQAAHAVEIARAAGDGALLAEALYAHGFALWRAGRKAETLTALEQTAARAEAAGTLEVLGMALNFIGMLCGFRGEARAMAYAARGLEVAERLGDPRMIRFASYVQGGLFIRSGDWGQAHAALERSLLIERRFGLAESSLDTLEALGWLCLHEGRWEEADSYVEEKRALAEQSGNRRHLQTARILWATRDILEGQPDRAYARLAPLLDAMSADPMTEPSHLADLQITVAGLHLELGEGARAAELIAALLPRLREHHAREHPEPDTVMRALWVQAAALVHLGHLAAAEEALAEGLALARAPSFRQPVLEALFLHVWGQMHLKRGEPAAAQERLEAALAIYQRVGARPWAAKVERDLAALEVESAARVDAPTPISGGSDDVARVH